uniref:Uncharacterized protein n=1 Tax=Plectus sambesii TaxID=2011161 RepID=A0A914WUQ6_9BILA
MILDLAHTLEIRCKMLQEIHENLHFPNYELASSVLVEIQDGTTDFTMIPFKPDEHIAFYDRHKNAVRKNSNPTPGRPDYQYDPKKAYETYQKEWERMEQVKKKHADELAKQRRQRVVDAFKKFKK